MTEKEYLESLHKQTQNAPSHDAVPAPATQTNQGHVESLNLHRNPEPDSRPHLEPRPIISGVVEESPDTLPSAEDLDAVASEAKTAEATNAN